jgi:predicted transcriptional regulator
MTIRLSDEMYADLVKVSKVEERPMSRILTQAIDEYIDLRKRDPEFQRRLRAWMDDQERIYRRLVA